MTIVLKILMLQIRDMYAILLFSLPKLYQSAKILYFMELHQWLKFHGISGFLILQVKVEEMTKKYYINVNVLRINSFKYII